MVPESHRGLQRRQGDQFHDFLEEWFSFMRHFALLQTRFDVSTRFPNDTMESVLT